MPISVFFRIQDAKGDTSTITIPIPDSTALTNVSGYVNAMSSILEDLINGTLVEAGFAVSVAVTPWQLAAPISDVQEKARFVFRGVNGFLKSISLPAVLESIFSPGSREVNQADPAVAAFITAIVDGVEVGGEDIEATDIRGDDLTNLVQATEAWGRMRG